MRILYNKLTKKVEQIIESDGITAFSEDIYVCIQTDEATIKDIIIQLDLDCTDMEVLMTDELKKVLTYKAKGTILENRFLVENNRAELSQQQNMEQLNFFSNVKILLNSGALGMALAFIQNADAALFALVPPYTTNEERKQSYITELQAFLMNN